MAPRVSGEPGADLGLGAGDERARLGGVHVRPAALQWAEFMRRTFGLDVLACSRCGGRLQLVALIEEAAIIQRILRHLGTRKPAPTSRPPASDVTEADFVQPGIDGL